ncbi:MAG: hypothetical protein H6943_10140 [Zoogloeaceae bacterium]|nr:hypothetical protein [Zoogloeaceae bacterium]
MKNILFALFLMISTNAFADQVLLIGSCPYKTSQYKNMQFTFQVNESAPDLEKRLFSYLTTGQVFSQDVANCTNGEKSLRIKEVLSGAEATVSKARRDAIAKCRKAGNRCIGGTLSLRDLK